MAPKTTILGELRRRGCFQTIGLYIVGAWLVLQVAALSFPGLDIPDSAIRYIWIGTFLCFPIALVIAWRYEFSTHGISRTPSDGESEVAPLHGSDKALIGSLAILFLAIVAGVFTVVFETRTHYAKSFVATSDELPSIAVLPFHNISNDPANEQFTAGIHDDLLTHISGINEIRVISRTSVLRINPTFTVPEIGKLLGVSLVLEGGVQRFGDRLRVNMQLIDAASDVHIWSEQFDRVLTVENVFAIQSEIASAITTKLAITVSPADKDKIEKSRPLNLEALEAYLLGRQQLILRTREQLFKAVENFEQAIALDASYALAYVGLADAYLLLNNYGIVPLEEALSVAEPALERALFLDPQLGPAHASLGLSKTRLRDFTAAEKSYRHAVFLSPNYAPSFHWLGGLLLDAQDRPSEAIPLLEKAQSLDPLSPVIVVTLGEALNATGKFEQALAQFDRALEIQPDYTGAYHLKGLYSRLFEGDLVAAIKWHQKELEIEPTRDSSFLGFAYLDIGDNERAEYWFNQARKTASRESYWPQATEIIFAVYQGNTESAVAMSRKLLEQFPGDNLSLFLFVSQGLYEEALEKIAPAYPELGCDVSPQITRLNLAQAINLSLAYENTGSSACAKTVLKAALERTSLMPRMGAAGFGISDVEIYARLGQTEQALDALEEALNANYRASWWGQLLFNPHLESIRQEPRFIAVTESIRADMARQRALLSKASSNSE